MTGTSFIVLSFAVTHGVPIALALRELRLLGKPSKGDRDEPPAPQEHLPKPLPDCLLPRPAITLQYGAQRPARVLEDA